MLRAITPSCKRSPSETRSRAPEDLARLCADGIWAHTCLLHVPKVRLTGVLEAIGEALELGGRLFVALGEGTGEGYRGEADTARWFANFQEGEFEGYIPHALRIVRRASAAPNDLTFLSYHLVRDG